MRSTPVKASSYHAGPGPDTPQTARAHSSLAGPGSEPYHWQSFFQLCGSQTCAPPLPKPPLVKWALAAQVPPWTGPLALPVPLDEAPPLSKASSSCDGPCRHMYPCGSLHPSWPAWALVICQLQKKILVRETLTEVGQQSGPRDVPRGLGEPTEEERIGCSSLWGLGH